jgi:hypothetical protein
VEEEIAQHGPEAARIRRDTGVKHSLWQLARSNRDRALNQIIRRQTELQRG